jgi:hypothetical protein
MVMLSLRRLWAIYKTVADGTDSKRDLTLSVVTCHSGGR